MAAAYVATALADGELAAAAGPVYQELYSQQYSHFRELARLFYASNRTIESYFWEVRRVLRDDSLTPREAFVRATAGQSVKGYERVVLERGELPPDFVEAVRALEQAQTRSRAARPGAAGVAARRRSRARAGPAAPRLERKAVLAEGVFAWGHVLRAPHRPEGIEVSPLIRRLVELCDGRRTRGRVSHRAERRRREPAPRTSVARTLVQALRILYVDGVVAELRERGA